MAFLLEINLLLKEIPKFNVTIYNEEKRFQTLLLNQKTFLLECDKKVKKMMNILIC